MTKTLNHIIYFFLHQNKNIFFSNIGNQNIFSPSPLQVKWSVPYRQTEIKWSFFVEHLNSWFAGTHENHENWYTTNKNDRYR
jgi:hypothetical protein